MKNLKITAMALLLTAGLSAQDLSLNDVPSNLKNSFEKAYPDANDQEWEMEGDFYKVEFEIDNNDHDIWYNKDGSTYKMESELHVNDLPEAIQNTLKNSYSDYNTDDITKIEQDNNTTYKVELEKIAGDKIVMFSSNGKVINEMMD